MKDATEFVRVFIEIVLAGSALYYIVPKSFKFFKDCIEIFDDEKYSMCDKKELEYIEHLKITNGYECEEDKNNLIF